MNENKSHLYPVSFLFYINTTSLFFNCTNLTLLFKESHTHEAEVVGYIMVCFKNFPFILSPLTPFSGQQIASKDDLLFKSPFEVLPTLCPPMFNYNKICPILIKCPLILHWKIYLKSDSPELIYILTLSSLLLDATKIISRWWSPYLW